MVLAIPGNTRYCVPSKAPCKGSLKPPYDPSNYLSNSASALANLLITLLWLTDWGRTTKQVLGGFGFDSCSQLKRKVLTSKLFPVHLKENHLISFFKVGAYSCPTANFGPLSKGQSHPILITSIYLFRPKVTGSLTTRLGLEIRPISLRSLNRDPSVSISAP